MRQFPEYPTITRQLPPRQLASFPAVGILGLVTRLWLWWLRRHINRDRYRLMLRGRNAKNPRRFRQSIPLNQGRKWGLYVDDKMGAKLTRYSEAVGAHPEACRADRLDIENKDQRARIRDLEENGYLTRQKLEGARDELAAVKLRATRDQLDGNANSAALDAIYRLMDGTEWNSDTTSAIGAVMAGLGYKIRDPNQPAGDHLADGKAGHPRPGRTAAGLLQHPGVDQSRKGGS